MEIFKTQIVNNEGQVFGSTATQSSSMRLLISTNNLGRTITVPGSHCSRITGDAILVPIATVADHNVELVRRINEREYREVSRVLLAVGGDVGCRRCQTKQLMPIAVRLSYNTHTHVRNKECTW